MATTKITITLPDEQVQEIRSLVAAGGATTVSAFVKHAVGVALSDAAGWREMLDTALQETGGPLTAKERNWRMRFLRPVLVLAGENVRGERLEQRHLRRRRTHRTGTE